MYLKKTAVETEAEFITLSEAKAHLRVSHSSEDTLISSLIEASIDFCADYLSKPILPQYVTCAFDGYIPKCFVVPYSPIWKYTADADNDSTMLLTYTNTDGDDTTYALYDYYVADFGHYGSALTLKEDVVLPTDIKQDANTVKIVYGAGYLSLLGIDSGAFVTDNLPKYIKPACLLMLAHLYENREEVLPTSMTQLPFGCRTMLDMIKEYF